MKILFLSDNFPPESNAPANRTYDHVREWVAAGHQVTVITCAPNFPRGEVFPGHANRLFQRQVMDGIDVIRVWTFITANEGFLPRTLDYLSFMVAAILASLRAGRPDVIVATSPQFFTAIAGWVVSKLKRRPWVFELRDLWPETIVAVGAMREGLLIRLLARLARFLYRSADLMVPVTWAFERHLLEQGVEPGRIVVVTNGIDPRDVPSAVGHEETRQRLGLPEEAFIASYIGTLGMCHGLETLLEAADLAAEESQLHFLIMGEGAERQMLEERIGSERLSNVTLLGGRPRAEALEVLAASDVALVLLRDSPVFETVIPSKIFESMALGRPILIGVRGESERIVVGECGAGLAFPPEDAGALVAALLQLAGAPERVRALGDNGRRAVAERFNRRTLARRMISEIQARFVPPAVRRSADTPG